jgi:hypothetical protein
VAFYVHEHNHVLPHSRFEDKRRTRCTSAPGALYRRTSGRVGLPRAKHAWRPTDPRRGETCRRSTRPHDLWPRTFPLLPSPLVRSRRPQAEPDRARLTRAQKSRMSMKIALLTLAARLLGRATPRRERRREVFDDGVELRFRRLHVFSSLIVTLLVVKDTCPRSLLCGSPSRKPFSSKPKL